MHPISPAAIKRYSLKMSGPNKGLDDLVLFLFDKKKLFFALIQKPD